MVSRCASPSHPQQLKGLKACNHLGSMSSGCARNGDSGSCDPCFSYHLAAKHTAKPFLVLDTSSGQVDVVRLPMYLKPSGGNYAQGSYDMIGFERKLYLPPSSILALSALHVEA